MSEHTSDTNWKETLSDDEYEILRECGTEPAGTGDHLDTHADGTFVCAGCGTELFDSETKFDSKTGWPSFYDAQNVDTRRDTSAGMIRTEVVCADCDGHLGHVFSDGPEPTGDRYCINSIALDFSSAES